MKSGGGTVSSALGRVAREWDDEVGKEHPWLADLRKSNASGIIGRGVAGRVGRGRGGEAASQSQRSSPGRAALGPAILARVGGGDGGGDGGTPLDGGGGGE